MSNMKLMSCSGAGVVIGAILVIWGFVLIFSVPAKQQALVANPQNRMVRQLKGFGMLALAQIVIVAMNGLCHTMGMASSSSSYRSSSFLV